MNYLMSRRAFLKASALTVGGSLLAACTTPAGSEGAPAGGSDAEAAATMETVELRLSAWADVQDAVVYDNMVNAYGSKAASATSGTWSWPRQ